MPRCWYVLLRFFLRVDKVLVKLRETRLFCPFSNDTTVGPIMREVKFSEGTFDELAKAGAPSDGVSLAGVPVVAVRQSACNCLLNILVTCELDLNVIVQL